MDCLRLLADKGIDMNMKNNVGVVIIRGWLLCVSVLLVTHALLRLHTFLSLLCGVQFGRSVLQMIKDRSARTACAKYHAACASNAHTAAAETQSIFFEDNDPASPSSPGIATKWRALGHLSACQAKVEEAKKRLQSARVLLLVECDAFCLLWFPHSHLPFPTLGCFQPATKQRSRPSVFAREACGCA